MAPERVMGMARITEKTELSFPRKMRTTKETARAARKASFTVSSTAARMKRVVSRATSARYPGGSLISPRAFFTPSATATALALGVLTTASSTAGRPFRRFRVLGASGRSSTRATSRTLIPREGSTKSPATSSGVAGVERRV